MKRILNQFGRLILTFGVFLYVVFEELVWDLIAQPVYEYLRALRLLQRIEGKIVNFKPLTLLVLFLLLFIQVEALGILALGLIAQGDPVVGMSIYLAKLPIAAFTFWMFRVSKHILMTFDWFKRNYQLMERGIDFIKSSNIHKSMVALILQVKTWLKSKSLFLKQVLVSIKTNAIKYLSVSAKKDN